MWKQAGVLTFVFATGLDKNGMVKGWVYVKFMARLLVCVIETLSQRRHDGASERSQPLLRPDVCADAGQQKQLLLERDRLVVCVLQAPAPPSEDQTRIRRYSRKETPAGRDI